LTDSEIPSEFEVNYEVRGKEWREDGDDLKKMFPNLWAKYNDSLQDNIDPTWSRKEPPAGL